LKWLAPQCCAADVEDPHLLRLEPEAALGAGEDVLLGAEVRQVKAVNDVLRGHPEEDRAADRDVHLVQRDDVVGRVELPVRPRVPEVPGPLLGVDLDDDGVLGRRRELVEVLGQIDERVVEERPVEDEEDAERHHGREHQRLAGVPVVVDGLVLGAVIDGDPQDDPAHDDEEERDPPRREVEETVAEVAADRHVDRPLHGRGRERVHRGEPGAGAAEQGQAHDPHGERAGGREQKAKRRARTVGLCAERGLCSMGGVGHGEEWLRSQGKFVT
jgi:hypothetical protein